MKNEIVFYVRVFSATMISFAAVYRFFYFVVDTGLAARVDWCESMLFILMIPIVLGRKS